MSVLKFGAFYDVIGKESIYGDKATTMIHKRKVVYKSGFNQTVTVKVTTTSLLPFLLPLLSPSLSTGLYILPPSPFCW